MSFLVISFHHRHDNQPLKQALFLYAVPFSEGKEIDKLSHLNHMVRLLQYVAQFVALLNVYDDTFLSIHHIVTNMI